MLQRCGPRLPLFLGLRVVAERGRHRASDQQCSGTHGERVQQWELKLRSFLEAGGKRGMDLRTFVTNEPVYG